MQLKIVLKTLTIVSLFTCFESISAEIYEECSEVENGKFVASLSDCRQYIYCNDDDSIIDECDDGEYFNGEFSFCDAKENVFCPLDIETNTDSEEGEDDEEENEVLESNEEEQTVESTMITTTTTILPTTIALKSTMNTLDTFTAPAIIRDSCPINDDPNQLVLLAHSESCSEYYVCYHGHAIEMHCTNHLHFNTQTGKCDFPENVQCLQNRPNANKCLPHITDFFPHTENCNYFYYCIKGFMTVQRCPFYYGWDMEKRACVKISQAKCYNKLKIL